MSTRASRGPIPGKTHAREFPLRKVSNASRKHAAPRSAEEQEIMIVLVLRPLALALSIASIWAAFR